MDDVGKLHTVPIQNWIKDDAIFKYWGDNVDKKRCVRDYRSDNQGELLHMYSILVGRSRTPAPELQHTRQLSKLSEIPNKLFLPQASDVQAVKDNLVILVSRILREYIPALGFLSGVVPKHILHKYSQKMSKKSEVVVLDILMKNETEHKDMLEIMKVMQGYLEEGYPQECRIVSGGDHLTCERQIGAQKHMMDGNIQQERLDVFEPVAEDWHCQLCIIMVHLYQKITIIIFSFCYTYFSLTQFLQMMWKALYGKSASDHGTLAFFRSQLRRVAVTADPKKDVNACVDLIYTVMKGHILACACENLNLSGSSCPC